VPRTLTTAKTSSIARTRLPIEAVSTTPPKASAEPVLVSAPTTIPEPAKATAIVAALPAASTSASTHRRGVIHVARSRKDSATVTSTT
jgi:hypothetical protein